MTPFQLLAKLARAGVAVGRLGLLHMRLNITKAHRAGPGLYFYLFIFNFGSNLIATVNRRCTSPTINESN